MYSFSIDIIEPDNTITKKLFPATMWEISCLLISNTGNKLIELKRYLPDGQQIFERYYITHFEIISE